MRIHDGRLGLRARGDLRVGRMTITPAESALDRLDAERLKWLGIAGERAAKAMAMTAWIHRLADTLEVRMARPMGRYRAFDRFIAAQREMERLQGKKGI